MAHLINDGLQFECRLESEFSIDLLVVVFWVPLL